MDEDFELQGKKYVIAEYPHGEMTETLLDDILMLLTSLCCIPHAMVVSFTDFVVQPQLPSVLPRICLRLD
jgi:hypothetical protein